MRELKFRAFDKSINKMVKVLMIWPGDQSLGLQYIDPDNNITLTTTVAKEQVFLMQFTGLKDKNGKEIYQSDRVKRRIHLVDGQDYIDYNCVIQWNGWCYGLFLHDKQCCGLDPITAREIEVTGNIYQNP